MEEGTVRPCTVQMCSCTPLNPVCHRGSYVVTATVSADVFAQRDKLQSLLLQKGTVRKHPTPLLP